MANSTFQPGDAYNPYRLFHGAVVPEVILAHKGLSATSKLLFAVLARHMGAGGKCYPKHRTLAEELGTGERTIRDSLDQLVKFQFIRVIERTGEDKGKHRSNWYEFIWNEFLINYLRVPEAETPPPPAESAAGHRRNPPLALLSLKESLEETTPLPPYEGGTFASGPQNGEEDLMSFEEMAKLTADFKLKRLRQPDPKGGLNGRSAPPRPN